MLRFSKTLPMFAVIMTLWICQTSFGQQAFDNWKISLGADGRTVSMTYSNPATFLNIESEFALDIDNAGEPVKGTIKFKNGFQRTMSPEEVNYYFEQYKGDRAYWDYSQAQGKITNFTSQTDQIPFGFLGRKARVLTTAGNTYIGTLGVNANTPAWFALDIRGNHILFYRQVVKEIQQLK